MLPLPGSLEAVMAPPIARAMSLEMDKPRPVPP